MRVLCGRSRQRRRGGRNRWYLELDDAFLREAEVHALGIFHVECAFVQLGDGVVGVKDGHLLVHFTDDEPRKRHSGHAAHQLHRTTVVDVSVAHRELFRLGFRVVDCKSKNKNRI